MRVLAFDNRVAGLRDAPGMGFSALDTPSKRARLDFSAPRETSGGLDGKSRAPGETSSALDSRSGPLELISSAPDSSFTPLD